MTWHSDLKKRELVYSPEKSTPDEIRIKNAYWQAYTDLWHKVKDTYGKQYAGDYDHDRDLRNELLSKFFSENFRALYFKSNKNAGEAYKAFHDKMYNPPSNKSSSSQPLTGGGGPGSTAEMRRCVESGRSLRRCYFEIMGNGFEQSFGFNPNKVIPVPAGPRMNGDYASAAGLRLIFEPDAVIMVCRGVRDPRPYTVEVTDTQALVKIQNASGPVVFSLRPDGKLSGSGPIKVIGLVVAGSHTEQTMGVTTQQTTRTKELTPLEASNYPDAQRNGQVYTVQESASELVYGPTGTQTVTNYATKTADCNAGLMSLIGTSPLPNEMGLSQGAINPLGVLTSLGSGLAVMMNGGSTEKAATEMFRPGTDKPLPPGLRMNGRYFAPTGFSLDFHPESVTLGCGEAEQALEYSVQRIGNRTTLNVKSNANPISFQLMPDGSIVGEGSVEVNGRMITGTTEDTNNPFIFAPRVARCEVGRLVTSGSAPDASAAMNTTSSTPTERNATANATSTPAANAGPRATSAGSNTLTVSSGPGVAKLLAGKPLVVLKDSAENVLAQAGLSAQGRSSRVSAWAHACLARDQLCQQGGNALGNNFVAKTGFDANGTATFTNVPSTGTFYLLAETAREHHLIWNVRVDLKPGANSIKLDESNMTPIDR